MRPSTNKKRHDWLVLTSALLLPAAASAYSTVSSAHPFDVPLLQRLEVVSELRTALPQSRARYSLGLGKNGPVGSVRADGLRPWQHNSQDNTYDAAKYLIEHEAVVEYPSPLHRLSQRPAFVPAAPSSDISSNAKPRALLRPRRFSPELIDIQQHPDRTTQPLAFAATTSPDGPSSHDSQRRRPQWELNTPWVEMLIHDQQLQFQAV